MQTIDPNNPPAIHEWTGPTGVHFRDVRSASGTYYHDTTPPAVVAALNGAMHTGKRIRLFLGDSETGVDWCEEFNVCGTVGSSTGWKKTALIIARSRSMGGPAILADCIVRLLVDGREVYRHPKYTIPTFEIRPIGPDERCGTVNLRADGYTHAVYRTDHKPGNIANFKNEASAIRYVQFMRGERGAK